MPEWIAHRGLTTNNATENTVAAFSAAMEAGYCCLETDLRAIRDGSIVLCHDPDFRRLGGPATPVEQMTETEVRAIKIGVGQDSPLFLDEFLEAFSAASWVFDVKPETGSQVVDYLLNRFSTPADRNVFSRISFVTWRQKDCDRLRAHFDTSRFFEGKFSCYRAGIACVLRIPHLGNIQPGRWYSLTPRLGPLELFAPQIVEAYHRVGAKVLAFLPESDVDLARAQSAGFDSILCDWSVPLL